jgi:hypothetical protein
MTQAVVFVTMAKTFFMKVNEQMKFSYSLPQLCFRCDLSHTLILTKAITSKAAAKVKPMFNQWATVIMFSHNQLYNYLSPLIKFGATTYGLIDI